MPSYEYTPCLTNNYPAVSGIVIQESQDTLEIGSTLTLTAQVLPETANYKEYSWSSSNDAIAIVNSSGIVTPVSKGTVTISATTQEGNYSDDKVIEIVQPVTSVSLDAEYSDLNIEGQIQLTATVLPEDANNKNVTWSSDNENVETVSDNGLVTAISAGNATITVTTEDGDKTDTCFISVLGIEIKTMPDKTQFYKGEPINIAGGVIKQYKAQGATEDINITSDMISGYDANTIGVQDINGDISYIHYFVFRHSH
jgi:uncharacterized protein YjdB